MCILSDIVILTVDILSYAVLRIIAVISVALIQVLRAPGAIIFFVLRNIMQGFTTILDYMIGYLTELIVTSALGCMSLIQDAFSALVGLLGTVFYEFLVYLHTALEACADLVWAILWKAIEMLGLSLLTIWNNFADAVVSFISNL
uniref:Uncharacterized protein n=1 Tax=Picea sitchensis TaxID=3332 RepID=A9NQW5_PICSI|nr:unknown [Picea sitchensis]